MKCLKFQPLFLNVLLSSLSCFVLLFETPIICKLHCLIFSHSLLEFCSFFVQSFYALWFILISYTCYLFRFTGLFLCNVLSVVNPIQYIFHFRYIFPSPDITFFHLQNFHLGLFVFSIFLYIMFIFSSTFLNL